jgi:hypothetical protein
MRTHAEHRDGGVQEAVHEVAEHTRKLVRLEGELAALEIRQKIAALGAGAVLLAAGGVLALFALGFLLATAAAALALVVSTWLALLIVAGALLLLAGVLAALGLGRIKRGTPPVPEQAIREARLTTEALKSNGSV